jgi:branched-chain amino acid aminotransferase
MAGENVVVNLNGTLTAPSDAKVSVFDRGFLYGDSVYEVVRTYRRSPFELGAHLARLAHSAERIGIALPWDEGRIRSELARTLDASYANPEPPAKPGAAPWNAGERYVRLIVTRGAGEIGLDPALAVDPLVIVIARPIDGLPLSAYQQGVKCALVGVLRNLREAVDPSAKTGNYLNNVMALSEARKSGAYEAIMLDSEGFVTEGSSSNVFAVQGGAVVTPPLDAAILQGVTRGVVLSLARRLSIATAERPLEPEDLVRASELFITSTIREIVPVTTLGDAKVAGGEVGPVTARLLAAFRELTRKP